jgi:5-methylcytosine-specific restriction endonuclease McrA
MPLRPCLVCGALGPESYCRAHRPTSRTRQTPNRGGGATARAFREAVLARDGYRCAAIEEGERCTVTDTRLLEVHHVVPLANGGSNDPTNGVTLCRSHHQTVEKEIKRIPTRSTTSSSSPRSSQFRVRRAQSL